MSFISGFVKNYSMGDTSNEIKKYREHIHNFNNKREDKFKEIDRRKICPFLMRVFYSENEFNSLEYFKRGNFPSRELHIHTWLDATLRELTNLIQSTLKLNKSCIYKFSVLFYDRNGNLQRKEVGDIYLSKNTPTELQTLQDINFKIGDYMDINIIKKMNKLKYPFPFMYIN